MAFRINPAGKRQVTLGEDLVFETTLRDRSNDPADLTNAGANLTIYGYEPRTALLTIDLSCDDATSGVVYGTVPAQSLYDALSPGLCWYQLKVAQSGTVLVAEQGTLNVLGGAMGPNPAEAPEAPTITLSPPTLPNGRAGETYSQTITASGGTGPYTYAVTEGELPSGLSLSEGGLLSGTPASYGMFDFIITATDSLSQTGSEAYSLWIAAPI